MKLGELLSLLSEPNRVLSVRKALCITGDTLPILLRSHVIELVTEGWLDDLMSLLSDL